ncbi:MAG: ZPR1 zinc finger domain-containing protein [Candidatus Hadarchaeales archaeon]
MRRREFVLPVERCPLCGSSGSFVVRGRIDEVPYFGEIMETLALCERCGFRQADVMQTERRDPIAYEFEITSEDDMKVRVVKSSTGIIRIPELAVTVRPGPASQGYVSNVEGVLNRIKEAVETAMENADESGRREGKARLEGIEKIKRGEKRALLILMDPHGNSAIADPRARVRPMSNEETSSI